MPRIAYSLQQKAEAVALATMVGAEAAADQLGMDVRTVRGWSAKAGKGPEMAVPTSSWEKLLDLAMARVSSALASGSVRPKDAAVIAGIASRNIRTPAASPNSPEVAAETRRQRYGLRHVIVLRMEHRMGLEPGALEAELRQRYDDPAVEGYVATCLQRYHQLHDCIAPGVLAEDAGSLPCPEPLADPWAWIDSLGYLDEWLETSFREETERRDARLAEVRAEREAARLAALSAEDRATLEAAEAWLAAQSEPAA